jgi:hypothetical protein
MLPSAANFMNERIAARRRQHASANGLDPSALKTYLNAGVVVSGVLLGFWVTMP